MYSHANKLCCNTLEYSNRECRNSSTRNSNRHIPRSGITNPVEFYFVNSEFHSSACLHNYAAGVWRWIFILMWHLLSHTHSFFPVAWHRIHQFRPVVLGQFNVRMNSQFAWRRGDHSEWKMMEFYSFAILITNAAVGEPQKLAVVWLFFYEIVNIV